MINTLDNMARECLPYIIGENIDANFKTKRGEFSTNTTGR